MIPRETRTLARRAIRGHARSAMRRGSALGLMLVTLAYVLAGCEGDEVVIRERFDAVETRLAGIERRQSDLESAVARVSELRERLDRLDLRVGSLESRIAQMAAAAGAPTGPGGAAASRGAAAGRPKASPDAEAARERTAALRALHEEYRRRLDELRALRESGASPDQLRAERSQLTRWFREQRRSIIFGSP